jgi:hypothetical protein
MRERGMNDRHGTCNGQFLDHGDQLWLLCSIVV